MGATLALQEFRKLRVPYVPAILLFSALKISSSLAVVGAIVGEFVGATKGLGYLIIISSPHLETATLFSAIIAAALLGIAMFYVSVCPSTAADLLVERGRRMNAPMSVDVIRVATSGPGDVSGLMQLIDPAGQDRRIIDPGQCSARPRASYLASRDFAREYAVAPGVGRGRCRRASTSPPRKVEEKIAFCVMSGGAKGVLPGPRLAVFARDTAAHAGRQRRQRKVRECRHRPQARLSARGNQPQSADRRDRQPQCISPYTACGIDDPGDVHFRADQMPLDSQRARPDPRCARGT